MCFQAGNSLEAYMNWKYFEMWILGEDSGFKSFFILPL